MSFTFLLIILNEAELSRCSKRIALVVFKRRSAYRSKQFIQRLPREPMCAALTTSPTLLLKVRSTDDSFSYDYKIHREIY
jgi:hypothetical protein